MGGEVFRRDVRQKLDGGVVVVDAVGEPHQLSADQEVLEVLSGAVAGVTVGDETIDRIRCVHTKRCKYTRNFMPERSYTQKNAYNLRSYPMLPLMIDLHAQGKLTPTQALFMAPRKPDEKFYDLLNDPYEIHNLSSSPQYQGTLKKMRAILEQWIRETGDQGRFLEKESAIQERDLKRIIENRKDPLNK